MERWENCCNWPCIHCVEFSAACQQDGVELGSKYAETHYLFSWEKNSKPTIPFAWVIPALHTFPNSAVKNEVTTIFQDGLKKTVICYCLSER